MTVLDASTKYFHESPFCHPIRFGLVQLLLHFFMRTNIGEAREQQEGASIATDTGITKKVCQVDIEGYERASANGDCNGER